MCHLTPSPERSDSPESAVQKCRFAKALPGFTTMFCEKRTLTVTYLGQGGWGGGEDEVGGDEVLS